MRGGGGGVPLTLGQWSECVWLLPEDGYKGSVAVVDVLPEASLGTLHVLSMDELEATQSFSRGLL